MSNQNLHVLNKRIDWNNQKHNILKKVFGKVQGGDTPNSRDGNLTGRTQNDVAPQANRNHLRGNRHIIKTQTLDGSPVQNPAYQLNPLQNVAVAGHASGN